ncbi:hypothetical protein [Streptomyces benahoarensis]|uniref:Uncharacterized protein n=1 Tax=Streptomyces benahoarensis TaxID=2595054 RepID=A0A553Y5H5_9ACTN|nr:hypothetical protein [Streptomyces benahoarensis]TSB24460.1 hypothetical protein FNZ23_27360 [Streptomyces benahoarensis]TSB31879.1 hypothetical protein FNJ62_04245 [Streptomyces benahoarensis]
MSENVTRWDYVSAVLNVDSTVTRSEKHLLTIYALHCDDYGQSWCGRQRLMDETGMSKPTFSKTKAEISAKGLAVIEARRIDANGQARTETAIRKSGRDPEKLRQTTDMVRLNIRALRAVARPARDYGDNVTAPQVELPGVGEGAKTCPLPNEGGGVKNLSPRGGKNRTPRGAKNLPPNLHRKPQRNSLRGDVSDDAAAGVVAGPANDEREEAPPSTNHTPPVPEQREPQPEPGQQDADRIVAAWSSTLATSGPVPNPQARDAVRRDVTTLLAQGMSADYLTGAATDMALSYPDGRLLSRHLAYYSPPPAAGAGPAVTRADLTAACLACDEHGQIDLGSSIANCKHPNVDREHLAAQLATA